MTYLARRRGRLWFSSQPARDEARYLNTPRLVADATGTTVWRWDQAEAFGNNPADEDPDANSVAFDLPLRLPGQRYDKETNLNYNYKRDAYDPGIGGFTQPDPLGMAIPGGPSPKMLNHVYTYGRSSPLMFIDPDGLCPCPGGIWDQEFGDFGFNLAFGGYISISNINLTCRSNKNLKCSGKQMCIGGGPIAGGGLSFALGGEVTGANDSNNLPGWGGWGGAVTAGPVSGQAGGDGVQTSAGPNAGWAVGGAMIRCLNYQMKCNCPCEK